MLTGSSATLRNYSITSVMCNCLRFFKHTATAAGHVNLVSSIVANVGISSLLSRFMRSPVCFTLADRLKTVKRNENLSTFSAAVFALLITRSVYSSVSSCRLLQNTRGGCCCSGCQGDVSSPHLYPSCPDDNFQSYART